MAMNIVSNKNSLEGRSVLCLGNRNRQVSDGLKLNAYQNEYYP